MADAVSFLGLASAGCIASSSGFCSDGFGSVSFFGSVGLAAIVAKIVFDFDSESSISSGIISLEAG